MYRHNEDIQVICNFRACLRDPVSKRVVPGTERVAHNVFTDVGRDWLAHLVVWSTIGSPDVPVTNRRLRWIGVGTGTQLEQASVSALNEPVEADEDGNYLLPLQTHDFPALKTVRVFKEFTTTEISTSTNPVVAVTEAGLFVDVHPVSSIGGVDDSAVGLEDTTLNRQVASNALVAYKTFDVINKTQDFNLEIQWELRF